MNQLYTKIIKIHLSGDASFELTQKCYLTSENYKNGHLQHNEYTIQFEFIYTFFDKNKI